MKRNTFLILGCALLVLAGLAIIVLPTLFSTPPIYESSAKLLVRFAHTPPAEWSIEDELEELQSETLLSHVITNLNLTARWNQRLGRDKLQTATTYSILRDQLFIHRLNQGNIVEIAVRSEDSIEAATIANAVARIASTQLHGPTNDTGSIVWSFIKSATPPSRSRDPNRFETTILPVGGLLLGLGGVFLLGRGLTKPNRSYPQPLHS